VLRCQTCRCSLHHDAGLFWRSAAKRHCLSTSTSPALASRACVWASSACKRKRRLSSLGSSSRMSRARQPVCRCACASMPASPGTGVAERSPSAGVGCAAARLPV